MRQFARFVRKSPAERIAISVAVAAVAVFFVWAALLAREITDTIYRNADVASAPVIAELLDDRGAGYVTLGKYPWLEPLFALHWTGWLPDHLTAWKAGPFVLYGLVLALVGWTVTRVSSRQAGLVVALAMAAPAPVVLFVLGAPDLHIGALAHVVILAAFLVTVGRLSDWGLRKRGAWGAALAVTLAPGVSTDALIVLGGVIPFLAAMGIGWRLRLLPGPAAGLAAAACLVGAAGGRALQALAEHDRIIYGDSQFEIAARHVVSDNVGLLLEDVAMFAHGVFGSDAYTDPINAFNAGRAFLAVAAIVAVLVLAWAVARSARSLLTDGERPAEQRLLAVYWVVSTLAVAASFVIVTAPQGPIDVRYLLVLWPALLTLVVVVYGRRAVTGLAVLAAGTAIVGCIELGRGLYTWEAGPMPSEREVEFVEEFVKANDLDHGFAGYWDAMPVTLKTEFEVLAYPIEPCAGEPSVYCEHNAHTIDSWYEPMDGVRTFFLVGHPSLGTTIHSPPAEWGPPIATAQLEDFTIYAYDYDIATQLRTVGPDARPPLPDASPADPAGPVS